VHCIGRQLPAFGLRVVPHARRGRPAQPFDADPGGFGNDQPGIAALAVIFSDHRIGDRARIGAATGQRSHQNAVLGFDRTQADRLEQGVVHGDPSIDFVLQFDWHR